MIRTTFRTSAKHRRCDPLAPTMSDEDVAALDAEIDQALESIGRGAPRR